MHYDPILCMNVEDTAKTKDAVYEEVESKGSYMLTKSESGRWAVLKNGMPLKYGMEKDMREFYKRVLKANGLDECPESMKDASPIPVAKVIETKGKYSIIQDDRGLYWVTIDKTGHGGGTAEVNLSNARRTLEHYTLMDKLEAKYGKKEGYKRYIAGETDECPEGMTCDTEFPSEKEAIEYCKENGIDPHNIKPIGDKFVVNDKKSVLDKAIRNCDVNYKAIAEEADKLFHGKYGWISNISDIETAINDATRRGNLADAKKLKQLKLKYDK